MWASGAMSGFCWDSPQQCLRGLSLNSLPILCHGWGRGWAPSPTPLSGGQKGLQAMGPQKHDNVNRSSSYLGCFLNAACFPGISSLHGCTVYEGEAHLTENQRVQIHLSKVVQLQVAGPGLNPRSPQHHSTSGDTATDVSTRIIFQPQRNSCGLGLLLRFHPPPFPTTPGLLCPHPFAAKTAKRPDWL